MAAPRPISVMLLSRSERLASVDKRTLREAGAVTRWSMTSGVEAARLLDGLAAGSRPETPDVIVCHQELEDMDGEQFCAMLRLHPRLVSQPVLLLLANDDEAQQMAALGCGASALLSRPYSVDALRRQLLSLTTYAAHERQLHKAAADADASAFNDALASYAMLLKPERRPEDYFNAALRCLEAGQWNTAIAAFQRALRAEHIKGEAELGIAAAYKGKGDKARYRAWLARAADTFARARRWHKARSAYMRLLQENPRARNPVLAAAQRLLRQGDAEGAAQALAAVHDITDGAAIADKLAQTCLASAAEDSDGDENAARIRAESDELIARLENHLKGELGDEALSLSREIRRQLAVLARQREERLRQAAEDRRREAAAFQLWQERRAARTDPGAQNDETGAASAEPFPPPDAPPQTLPPRHEAIEPLTPSRTPFPDDRDPATEPETVSPHPLFNDILSVIRCTWQLSRRRKK
ncbi:MAG: response regulator [Desulfovibrio sp.]|uniref:response regulator n=1 Tax=Desulfovibrio sp. TaxID=885 RepID=UPI0025B816CA|nr:response regulator [Desulfovibrio sp.]MCI7569619.1 response regulator [Desulfovibrio sp.]